MKDDFLKHFDKDDFIVSREHGDLAELCKNNAPDWVWRSLYTFGLNILEPARVAAGFPLRITNGYRDYLLNKTVGGARNSYHLHALAVDVTAWYPKDRPKLFTLYSFIKNELVDFYDEVILYKDERGNPIFIHVAGKRFPKKEKQLAAIYITLDGKDGKSIPEWKYKKLKEGE